MPQIIVAIDCTGSAVEKDLYGEEQAIQRITAALIQAQCALQDADLKLRRAASAAGDSILLIGGSDAVGIYKAAVVHQGIFRSWHYNRIPLKIAIGYGEFQSIDAGEFTDHRGWDLDFLHRILEACPPAGVILSPPFASLIRDSRFGDRLIELQEELKGFGRRTFYESNGDYVIPPHLRQRAHRRKSDASVRARRARLWMWWAMGIAAYTTMFAAIYFRGALP